MSLLIKKTPDAMTRFDNLWSDFFDMDNWMDKRFARENWIPAVNVVEVENGYEIQAMVPGMKKEDFDVRVQDGFLILTGENKEEKKEEDKAYFRREYVCNSFSRSFRLPEGFDEKSIKANYQDGVLKVFMGKKPEKTPKKEGRVINLH